MQRDEEASPQSSIIKSNRNKGNLLLRGFLHYIRKIYPLYIHRSCSLKTFLGNVYQKNVHFIQKNKHNHTARTNEEIKIFLAKNEIRKLALNTHLKPKNIISGVIANLNLEEKSM